MWDRKELKAKGKAAYRANRITCIIAALLLMIVSGGATTGTSVGSSWNNIHKNMNNDSSYSQDIDDVFSDIGDNSDDIGDIGIGEPSDPGSTGKALLSPVVIAVILVIALVAVALGLALGVFLFNPAQVGLQKFFIDNAMDQTTGLDRSNIGVAFDENYMKVVGSMFTTGLFTFLWCLVFIIPGIYKAYCWRLVPYIISEDPAITGAEARARSNELMYGSKWASFVLDLSFLGWKILGALTLGILNIVFTDPYQAATNAELYLTLSGRPSEMAAPSEFREETAADAEFEVDQEGLYD